MSKTLKKQNNRVRKKSADTSNDTDDLTFAKLINPRNRNRPNTKYIYIFSGTVPTTDERPKYDQLKFALLGKENGEFKTDDIRFFKASLLHLDKYTRKTDFGTGSVVSTGLYIRSPYNQVLNGDEPVPKEYEAVYHYVGDVKNASWFSKVNETRRKEMIDVYGKRCMKEQLDLLKSIFHKDGKMKFIHHSEIYVSENESDRTIHTEGGIEGFSGSASAGSESVERQRETKTVAHTSNTPVWQDAPVHFSERENNFLDVHPELDPLKMTFGDIKTVQVSLYNHTGDFAGASVRGGIPLFHYLKVRGFKKTEKREVLGYTVKIGLFDRDTCEKANKRMKQFQISGRVDKHSKVEFNRAFSDFFSNADNHRKRLKKQGHPMGKNSIKDLTCLVIGPKGSGKTSFIKSVQRSVHGNVDPNDRRNRFLPQQMILRNHNRTVRAGDVEGTSFKGISQFIVKKEDSTGHCLVLEDTVGLTPADEHDDKIVEWSTNVQQVALYDEKANLEPVTLNCVRFVPDIIIFMMKGTEFMQQHTASRKEKKLLQSYIRENVLEYAFQLRQILGENLPFVFILSEKDLIADNYPTLLPDPSEPDKLESEIKNKYFGGHVNVYIVENFVHTREFSRDFQKRIRSNEKERNEYVKKTKEQYASILHLMKLLMIQAREKFEYRETARFLNVKRDLVKKQADEGPVGRIKRAGSEVLEVTRKASRSMVDYMSSFFDSDEDEDEDY
mmetsp:Transcript_14409/g.17479  ORF Transcript_14409/g.17479 Transcript_14409/m.17479 type:complete len:726 (-) Transcript_14409:1903-4080(-)|eukprot:CAMPEP_0184015806 /NCGR_PEP_ID=MMETSP0954-20121128/6562_1 /TAXON_ID=627963 /ORGANISM="Aplanochytrium sp, Strain PBS07" /LENGTH=725 /DNA_ID=CAMNT_0026296725 /DNA_START=117 /DNA_END=2294 /DNA_ORIENTATION=-